MSLYVDRFGVLWLSFANIAGAYTAAGATVTRDVPEDAMLIARAEPVIKPGLARRFRREKK